MAFGNQNGYGGGFGYQNTYVSTIPGRLIDREDEIRPNEIPMNGAVAFFPASDYSCVFAKAWNSRGTFDTVKYVPENRKAPAPTSSLPITAEDIEPTSSVDSKKLDEISARLTQIENVLIAALQPLTQQQTQTQPPAKPKRVKEASSDE